MKEKKIDMEMKIEAAEIEELNSDKRLTFPNQEISWTNQELEIEKAQWDNPKTLGRSTEAREGAHLRQPRGKGTPSFAERKMNSSGCRRLLRPSREASDRGEWREAADVAENRVVCDRVENAR